MWKEYKGNQPIMHDSKIHQEEGFLGKFKHEQKLKVGYTQSMFFGEGEQGLFCISSHKSSPDPQ
jgi:hypothetical protein